MCNKYVSKRNPGIQCSKCNKWLHATCASLTTDQLSALSVTDSLDWKCRQCTMVPGGKSKRISVILPDPEEEESDTEGSQAKILEEIHREVREMRKNVREIIREELQTSLSYYSDKIDDFDNKVKDFEIRLKLMENQCKETTNMNKNVTLINEVLEQKLNKMEQTLSANNIEICGVDEVADENIQQMASSYCLAIKQQPQDILRVYRKKKISRAGSAQAERAKRDSPIVVTLREGCRDRWLVAGRISKVQAHMIGGANDKEVHARESLSPTISYLLWKAKTELKDKSICKFVWCKNGSIMVRKSEGDKKVHYVRTPKDIEKIAKEMVK